MASLRPILLAALLMAARAGAEVRVITDASISAQGTGYGLDWVYSAKLAPDGGVWLVGSHYDLPNQPYAVGEYEPWLGRFTAEGLIAQTDSLGRSQYQPIFISGSDPDFEVSADRRHAVYASHLGGPREVRTLSMDALANAVVVATNGAAVASDDGPTWANRGFGSQLAIDNQGHAVVGGFNGRAAAEPLDTPNRTAIWRISADSADPIAVQGNPAPGVPSAQWAALGRSPQIGTSLLPLDVPVATNGSGAVAFAAGLGVEGLSNIYDGGVWVDHGAGPTTLVARTGQPAPGTDGRLFAPNGFAPPAINSAGRVAFFADFFATGNQWDGLWRQNSAGVVELIALRGLPEPTSDVDPSSVASFYRFDEFAFNDRGDVAFQGLAFLPTPPGGPLEDDYVQESAIWLAKDGELPRRFTTSQASFETPLVNEWDIAYSDLKLNNTGQVAYIATVNRRETSGAIYTERVARVLGTDGETTELLRVGDFMPLGPNGAIETSLIIDLRLHDFDDAGRALLGIETPSGHVALVVTDGPVLSATDGDYNRDGLTNAADYDAWRATYGQTVRIGDGADGNLDGVIDAADYTVWRDAFNATSPSAAVPEPTALVLLAAALAASLSGRST